MDGFGFHFETSRPPVPLERMFFDFATSEGRVTGTDRDAKPQTGSGGSGPLEYESTLYEAVQLRTSSSSGTTPPTSTLTETSPWC